MSEKTEVVQTMSDQVNSVINNLADKLEAPAGEISKMASAGFEKYVEYIFASGISTIFITCIFLAVFVTLGVIAWRTKFKVGDEILVELSYKTSQQTYNRHLIIFKWVGGIISVIGIFICLGVIGTNLPQTLAPEGYAVKEVIEAIRK